MTLKCMRKTLGAALGIVGLFLAYQTLFAATGTIMPTPFQVVFDANGNPVSGAKVCTYSAGTTTPVTTYTDVNLTTPNTNPIIADSAGRFTAFLTTGVSYKFVYQDSTGTAATCDGATIKTVDNILAVPGTANPTTTLDTVNLRLTLTSGTPVTTSDVTGATTIFIEPYKGNRIALYDGSTWNLRTVTATSFAVPATTSTMYDVFAFDSSATPAYETLAWTNDTTRATGLTTQDGVLAKSGATTRRYIGSFRTTTSSGQTEDSAAKRYLWNYYNRIARTLQKTDVAASWTYTTAAYRQANGSTANQVDLIVGFAESRIDLSVQHAASNSGGVAVIAIGIGEDTTTPTVTASAGTPAAATNGALTARMVKYPAIGRHFYTWLENSVTTTGTTTWVGLATQWTGLFGSFEG